MIVICRVFEMNNGTEVQKTHEFSSTKEKLGDSLWYQSCIWCRHKKEQSMKPNTSSALGVVKMCH